MDNSYRIKANIGKDQVLNVNLKQDIDIYEILSLKLTQENIYKLHSADYGVIVGRVLGNDAFGIPNVKVTVFIPLSDYDKLRSDIRSIYPYSFVTDCDNRNVKFNALPNYKKFECHQEVGSFPKKQLVLDDDSVLEVYDKYYKYSTVTNQAGDYMIFGVPVGEQILHIDVDLSDIGILSQEPRDFIYKGYSMDLFESPTQFKRSTNLDDLPQIQNQNASVTVYPLWGDKNTNEIAITRKDINLQYKFETTCVFLGSVITDNGQNSISHNCIPDSNVGDASQLIPSKGNIEMIRKTINDTVEEFPIKGNQLIDSDGTWCYQIPMNLDYVGMDECGNIIPINDSNKGIPTRARVRFRITLDEPGEDNLTRHRARYLIPNNPDLYEGNIKPCVKDEVLDNDSYYEFGTLTPNECFRDLYWNKVYSVKNYIPRIQKSKYEKTENYLAIKGVNKKNASNINPIPYNKLNLNFSISSYLTLYQYLKGNNYVKKFWTLLKSKSIPYNIDDVRESIVESFDAVSLDFYNDWLNGCLYFPLWFWRIRQKKKAKKGESVYESSFCECKNTTDKQNDGVYLFNNCSLVYKDSALAIEDKNNKANTSRNKNQDLYYDFGKLYTTIPFGSKQFESGVIKKMTNKDGADAYYYTFGNMLSKEKVSGNVEYNNSYPSAIRPADGKRYYKYARLFSTDLILLGSLKQNDIDGIPMVEYSMPSTTSNIPPIGIKKTATEEGDVQNERTKETGNTTPYGTFGGSNTTRADSNTNVESQSVEADFKENDIIAYNGMHWGSYWFDNNSSRGHFSRKYSSGLFFGMAFKKLNYAPWGHSLVTDISTIVPYSDLKTCVNAERICELGVTLDSTYEKEVNGSTYKVEMDGFITKDEIDNSYSRALFATLNCNNLIGTVENYYTGYKKYDLDYTYPTNFDGRMGDELQNHFKDDTTKTITGNCGGTTGVHFGDNVNGDERSHDYLRFRLGYKYPTTKGTLALSYYATTYRNIYSGFNGKHSHTSASTPSNATENSSNGQYNEYSMYNGYIKNKRFVENRGVHFYGYENEKDKVYPLYQNRKNLQDYPLTFPLYNNSFYFYFGINQGSTAIDKFYEAFYTKCVDENKKPFILTVSLTASTACNATGGIINVNVQEISFPCSIKLYKNNELVKEANNVLVYDTSFNGLSNGDYEVEVTDSYGSYSTEKVSLNYQKVTLNTTTVREIQTEYIDQTCHEICDNDYYGKLRIDSYTLYGVTHQVNNIIRTSEDGTYKIGDGPNGQIRIKFIPVNGDGFYNNYVCQTSCSAINDVTENIINFRKPGTFSVSVYEMCNGEISDNISYYTIVMPDTKRLEMYVNGVPLKYIVGYKEDFIPYNQYFHNSGETVSGISAVSIKGWFGVHNPATYDDLFKYPLQDDKNKELWYRDINSTEPLDIVSEKLRYMFNLSNGTYITAGGNNKYLISASGAEGDILIRCGKPNYTGFKIDNTDVESGFTKYVTNEDSFAECNEFNPNIVSENYRYAVKKSNYIFPSIGDEYEINKEGSVITGSYNFNPKYKNNKDKAANYFAAFSNNANIVVLSKTDYEETCEQIADEEYKPYQVIPYKAHDLYKDNFKMCLEAEKNDIQEPCYKPFTSSQSGKEYKKYFRTEFIDRRFDYNAFFITGRKPNHFDVNEYEEDILKNEDTNKTIWLNGRISALTYNGIEMLYPDDKNNTLGGKLIVSESASTTDTEYKYYIGTSNLPDAKVVLNLNKKKRFYESKLYYGNEKYVDLIDAYYYSKNTEPKAIYTDKNGVEKTCNLNVNTISNDNSFNNFGLSGGTIYGYPSKRWLDYYNIPFGENYHFNNISCSYDGIAVEETYNTIKAFAVPGEVVSFNIEAGELINLVCGEFESDCKNNYYNIGYSLFGTAGQEVTFVSTNIKDLSFKIISSGSTGFKSKIEKSNNDENLGIMICHDDSGHTSLTNIKSSTTFENCKAAIANSTIKTITSSSIFDTDEEFKNTIFKVSSKGDNDAELWKNEYKFINIMFDRLYYSLAGDSLMKRIRVLNTSTIYNVDDFNLKYVRYDIVSEDFVVPVEDANNNSEETENNRTRASESSVSRKVNYTEFEFKSKFLAHCLNKICFKINFNNETAYYAIDESTVSIIETNDDSIRFGVLWKQHNSTLKSKPQEYAAVTAYLMIKNNIKSERGEGFMEFKLDFKIQGEQTIIYSTQSH